MVQKLLMRPMTIDDLSDVCAIENLSFHRGWTEGMFRGEINSPSTYVFVAVDRKGCVGYISFEIIIDEIHLRNVAVHPSWRQKGLASCLMKEMLGMGKKSGARWCTLEVRRSNRGAISLYEKFGFTVEGVRPLYYSDTQEDALIMWLEMDKPA